MLVLSRDCDSAVKIGNGIRVKVLSIRRQRVKLGVEAPKDVRVWREEVKLNSQELDSTDTHPIRVDTTFDSSGRRNHFDLPILVVEDDPEHAAWIRKILTDHGCNQVTIVSNGAKSAEMQSDGCGKRDKDGRCLVRQLTGASGLGE